MEESLEYKAKVNHAQFVLCYFNSMRVSPSSLLFGQRKETAQDVGPDCEFPQVFVRLHYGGSSDCIGGTGSRVGILSFSSMVRHLLQRSWDTSQL